MSGAGDYVSATDGSGALRRQDGVTRLKLTRLKLRGELTMNVHDGLLTELIRERRLHMLDEAKHWTSRVKLRRRAPRERTAA
jgi:hypothetical protein